MFDAQKALNRICKWRSVFAGWQLGTRSLSDPECQAVRDHRELSIILRVEQTALATVLIKKGVITAEEFTIAIGDEADILNADYERRFPGITSTDEGIVYDKRAIDTMKGWLP